MHRLVFVMVLVLAAVAHAQLVPAGSGGCPAAWHHREGNDTSFSCRDTTTGAFCNGQHRPPAGVTQADEAAAAHAEIVARGFTIQRELDERGMHAIVYDDSAGHRIVQFVRRDVGRAMVVTCGSDPAAFDPQWSLFSSVAHSAR